MHDNRDERVTVATVVSECVTVATVVSEYVTVATVVNESVTVATCPLSGRAYGTVDAKQRREENVKGNMGRNRQHILAWEAG